MAATDILRKRRKPDRQLYVFPARRSIGITESDQSPEHIANGNCHAYNTPTKHSVLPKNGMNAIPNGEKGDWEKTCRTCDDSKVKFPVPDKDPQRKDSHDDDRQHTPIGKLQCPNSSCRQESRKVTMGRGRLLKLQIQHELEKCEDHHVENNVASSEKTSSPTMLVNANNSNDTQTVNTASHSSTVQPMGMWKNKHDTPKRLSVGRARLHKRHSTSRTNETNSVGVTSNCHSPAAEPEVAVGQFDDDISMKEESFSSANSSISNDEFMSCKEENDLSKDSTFSWADEMEAFDKLNLEEEEKSSSNDIVDSIEIDKLCHRKEMLHKVDSCEVIVSNKKNQHSTEEINTGQTLILFPPKTYIASRSPKTPIHSNKNIDTVHKSWANVKVNGTQVSAMDLRNKINGTICNTRTTFIEESKQMNETNTGSVLRSDRNSRWAELFRTRCSLAAHRFIDSHCHIDMIFNERSEKQYVSFQEFKEANWSTFPKEFSGCVTVFCDPRNFDSKGSLFRSLASESNVWIAMGCHPKKVRYLNPYRMQQLENCVRMSSVAAVGEIGLDYSGTFHQEAEAQQKAFRDQLRLALKVNKPIVIHCREAEEDGLRILKEECPLDWPIHLHCYTQTFDYAQKWLNTFPNLYIGLTPKVTYKSSTALHDTASKVPLNRLLLETDSPYFIPNMVPRNAMVSSHPAMAFTVAETVAELRNISVKEVLRACLENTQKLYRIQI